jgi:hypothetical protein
VGSLPEATSMSLFICCWSKIRVADDEAVVPKSKSDQYGQLPHVTKAGFWSMVVVNEGSTLVQ